MQQEQNILKTFKQHLLKKRAKTEEGSAPVVGTGQTHLGLGVQL